MTELIIVKQLPVIEEQLRTIKGQIEEKVANALSLVCTEETVKTVKETRAELNRNFNELEEKRKEVKNKVLSPYEQFEAVYKDCVSGIFKAADQQLKEKIDAVEEGLREQKKTEILEYFNECLAAAGIDFVSFEQTGISITLSASKKTLKEKAKDFVGKVADELALIDTQEFKAEILVEYKRSLNVASSITAVTNRHKAIEAEREREEARQKLKESQAAAVAAVAEVLEENRVETAKPPEILCPPEVFSTPEPIEEKQYQASFVVTGTIQQLKALKEFLNDGGYQYVAK